ncbi:MAG: hypothetical protein IJV95_03755 [Clostridia bacterium]|nr:hypothetical protein [Clostridia bacterium]
MNGLIKKFKWFIVATLAILVVGMTLFGIFGFNNTVDFKDSYEVKVSIDQNVDDAIKILKETTDEYFESNGINDKDYAFQEAAEGATLIYKFANVDKTLEGKLAGLTDKLNTALTTTGAQATVDINKVSGVNDLQTGWVILALGIAMVAIFIYLLIMEKLASAVAVICSSALSMLLFVAIMAITRIPAIPYVEVLACLAGIIAAVLAVTTVGRYREEVKNANGKFSAQAVAESVAKKDKKKYLLALIATLVAAVAVAAFFVPYIMIMGAQIAVAGLVATFAAYFMTPFMWTLIKGRKNK